MVGGPTHARRGEAACSQPLRRFSALIPQRSCGVCSKNGLRGTRCDKKNKKGVHLKPRAVGSLSYYGSINGGGDTRAIAEEIHSSIDGDSFTQELYPHPARATAVSPRVFARSFVRSPPGRPLLLYFFILGRKCKLKKENTGPYAAEGRGGGSWGFGLLADL